MILITWVKKGALPAGRYTRRARRTEVLVVGDRTAAAELIRLQIVTEIVRSMLKIRYLEFNSFGSARRSSAQGHGLPPDSLLRDRKIIRHPRPSARDRWYRPTLPSRRQ